MYRVLHRAFLMGLLILYVAFGQETGSITRPVTKIWSINTTTTTPKRIATTQKTTTTMLKTTMQTTTPKITTTTETTTTTTPTTTTTTPKTTTTTPTTTTTTPTTTTTTPTTTTTTPTTTTPTTTTTTHTTTTTTPTTTVTTRTTLSTTPKIPTCIDFERVFEDCEKTSIHVPSGFPINLCPISSILQRTTIDYAVCDKEPEIYPGDAYQISYCLAAIRDALQSSSSRYLGDAYETSKNRIDTISQRVSQQDITQRAALMSIGYETQVLHKRYEYRDCSLPYYLICIKFNEECFLHQLELIKKAYQRWRGSLTSLEYKISNIIRWRENGDVHWDNDDAFTKSVFRDCLDLQSIQQEIGGYTSAAGDLLANITRDSILAGVAVARSKFILKEAEVLNGRPLPQNVWTWYEQEEKTLGTGVTGRDTLYRALTVNEELAMRYRDIYNSLRSYYGKSRYSDPKVCPHPTTTTPTTTTTTPTTTTTAPTTTTTTPTTTTTTPTTTTTTPTTTTTTPTTTTTTPTTTTTTPTTTTTTPTTTTTTPTTTTTTPTTTTTTPTTTTTTPTTTTTTPTTTTTTPTTTTATPTTTTTTPTTTTTTPTTTTTTPTTTTTTPTTKTTTPTTTTTTPTTATTKPTNTTTTLLNTTTTPTTTTPTTMPTATTTSPKPCTARYPDIFILLDESSLITRRYYRLAQAVISGLIDEFTVGPKFTRFGFMTYSKRPSVKFFLRTTKSAEDMKKVVNAERSQPLSQQSIADRALGKLINKGFQASAGDRVEAGNVGNNIGIVFTHRATGNRRKTIRLMMRLKRKQRMMVVAAGKQKNSYILQLLSSRKQDIFDLDRHKASDIAKSIRRICGWNVEDKYGNILPIFY